MTKPRIYQFLDHIRHSYRNMEVAHKIHCPFHSDEQPSAKVYPGSNTIHCFAGCNRTWTVESGYACWYRVPYGRAIEECNKLFPEPVNPLFWRPTAVSLTSKWKPSRRDVEDLLRSVETYCIEHRNVLPPAQFNLGVVSAILNRSPIDALDYLLVLNRKARELVYATIQSPV